MRLTVEIEGEGVQPPLPAEGRDLVAFMSFCVVRGFGANHPLIALADRLHDVHHVRLGPLTTFYETAAEDAEDREKLELSWQPAADLAATLEAMIGPLATDPQLQALLRRADACGLPLEVSALATLVAGARDRGARVRLGYEL